MQRLSTRPGSAFVCSEADLANHAVHGHRGRACAGGASTWTANGIVAGATYFTVAQLGLFEDGASVLHPRQVLVVEGGPGHGSRQQQRQVCINGFPLPAPC